MGTEIAATTLPPYRCGAGVRTDVRCKNLPVVIVLAGCVHEHFGEVGACREHTDPSGMCCRPCHNNKRQPHCCPTHIHETRPWPKEATSVAP